MERAVAVKKLGKLLGKHFGFRVNSRAPDAEERAEGRQLLPALDVDEKQAETAMEARRKAILAADLEYQDLVAAYQVARKRRREVAAMTST